MKRCFFEALSAAVIAVLAVPAMSQTTDVAGTGTAKDPDTQALTALLQFRVETKDFQKSMNLKEFLELLSKKVAPLELPIVVNVKAFKDENPDAPDIYDTQIQFQPFPKKMQLATALRLALTKVNPPNATFILHDGIIEITTIERGQRQSLFQALTFFAKQNVPTPGASVWDPKLPISELLPPTVKPKSQPPAFNEDLARVAEVSLLDAPRIADMTLGMGQAAMTVAQLAGVGMGQPPVTLAQFAGLEITNQVARVRHLNQDVTDGFMKTLLHKRADLSGLPFKMGDECREVGDRAKLFGLLAALVRRTRTEAMEEAEQSALPLNADRFWSAFHNHNQEIKEKVLQQTGCSGVTYDSAARGSTTSRLCFNLSPSREGGSSHCCMNASCCCMWAIRTASRRRRARSLLISILRTSTTGAY